MLEKLVKASKRIQGSTRLIGAAALVYFAMKEEKTNG